MIDKCVYINGGLYRGFMRSLNVVLGSQEAQLLSGSEAERGEVPQYHRALFVPEYDRALFV